MNKYIKNTQIFIFRKVNIQRQIITMKKKNTIINLFDGKKMRHTEKAV